MDGSSGSAGNVGKAEPTPMTNVAPLYSNQHLFEYGWGVVTTAWLEKFPDPKLPQVSSVETVGRIVNEEQQSMHLRRLFHCSFKIPRLVTRLLGERATVICVEEAHWDLKRHRLTVHGRNETWQHVIRIDEVCCYTEVAPGQTLYTQQATVTYRKGLLSGLLMPVVNELCAGVCQRHARAGVTAMADRIAALAGKESQGKTGQGGQLALGTSDAPGGTSTAGILGFGVGALIVTGAVATMCLRGCVSQVDKPLPLNPGLGTASD